MLPVRSGEVFGRGTVGVASRDRSVRESVRSSLGVGVGDELGEFEDQKCFFFVGGLPELCTAGELDAERGLFGRFTIERAFSARADPEKSKVAGSAVLGRTGVLSSSKGLGEFINITGLRGVGLAAIELILPETECPYRMVEQLPSVSEDINESGRGIISTRSAKPTRGRGPGLLSRRRGEDGVDRVLFGVSS
jgi:hypothetical protein